MTSKTDELVELYQKLELDAQRDIKGVIDNFKKEHRVDLSQNKLRRFVHATGIKCCSCTQTFDNRREFIKHLNKESHWLNLREHKANWNDIKKRFNSVLHGGDESNKVKSYADANEAVLNSESSQDKTQIPEALKRSFYEFLFNHYCLRVFKKQQKKERSKV